MLIAALIFVISLATVIQFAVLSWRAGLLRVASEPVSTQWESLADCTAKPLIKNDFLNITAYGKLCPDIGAGSAPKFWTLRAYYRLLQGVEKFSRAFMPQNLGWTAREMALCTRCAAVMLSRQLERNQALSVAARSF
jgi:hypothetical protein